MRYRITVEWKDCDERAAVTVRATDPGKACESALDMADDGRLRTVNATWDPEPAYVTAAARSDGRPLKVPPSFAEGAVHVGDDWIKAHATAAALLRMRRAEERLRGIDARAAAEIAAIRTGLQRPRIDAVVDPASSERDYSVVVAWFEKANVLEVEVEADTAEEACSKAVAQADEGRAVLQDLPELSDAFVLAIIEGREHRCDEIVEHSLDVPAPWSEGWRLHPAHLRSIEVFETELQAALAAFRSAAADDVEVLALVTEAERDFENALPRAASVAPGI